MEQAKQFILDNDMNQDSVEDRLYNFLELSQKLQAVLSHENAILEACGFLNLDSYLAHKTALIQIYEQQAESLCRDLESGVLAHSHAAHSLLVEEITAVHATLTDNTMRQFSSLEKTILDKAVKFPGEKSWH